MIEVSGNMPAAMVDMMKMVEQLSEEFRPRQLPQHPCQPDQERTRCTSAQCLLMSGPLSPACMQMLRDVAPMEPSPSPEPFIGGADFSVVVESSNGVLRETDIHFPRHSGGMSIPPEVLNMMNAVLPFDLGAIFEMPFQRQAKANIAQAEEEEAGGHPCEMEIFQCTAAGPLGRDELTDCLIANYEQLSSHCKCFVHHLVPEQKIQAHQSSSAPHVRAIPIGIEPVRTVEIDVIEIDLVRRPRHSFACILFMPLMLFATILLVRRCCIRFAKPKPEFAAVVLSKPATIKTATEPLVWVPPLTAPLVMVDVGKQALPTK